MFHPLAYLVKLNIEMSMTNLIMKIVLVNDHDDDISHLFTFATRSFGETPTADNFKRINSIKKWVPSIRSTRDSSLEDRCNLDDFLTQDLTKRWSQEEAYVLALANSNQRRDLDDIEPIYPLSQNFSAQESEGIQLWDQYYSQGPLSRPERTAVSTVRPHECYMDFV